MQQPPSGAPPRPLPVVLWGLLAFQLAAGAVAVVLVQTGHAPVLGRYIERVVAYAWVVLTIAAAIGAYVLAAHDAGEPIAFGRAVAAALLASLGGLAGVVAFYLVKVWPMLVVGLLAALLGIAAPYRPGAPRPAQEADGAERSDPAAEAATADHHPLAR